MRESLIDGVNIRELYYISNNASKFYNKIEIPKKKGGIRIIYAPQDKLKYCQQFIVKNYLDDYTVSKYATAYHKGASILSNALPHTNRKNILKLDIKNFFDSIDFVKVYNVFYEHYPQDVSKLFAELCCYKDRLVQGSPASPTLSNLVMRRFDNALGKWCDERNISYTRYCDDLTFSSNDDLHIAYHKAKRMLYNMGFELNGRKTHFVNSNYQQNVTGVVVNEKPQVSSDYRRKLRQEIFYCRKFGVENHMSHSGIDADKDDYLKSLVGKVNYVLTINPDDKEMQEYKLLLKTMQQ
ncbi:MAG: retron St85 family RNA-directed DNA polymerase [Eubacteriales bacterium]|nr:retron St85 family RNA-directed DNA polymerase [Eubacteriales bacterium]